MPAFKACVRRTTNGASWPDDDFCRYFGAASAGVVKHLSIPLRDRPVRLSISLIDLPSCGCKARILPFKAVVITVPIPCRKLPQVAAGQVVHPGQRSVGTACHAAPRLGF